MERKVKAARKAVKRPLENDMDSTTTRPAAILLCAGYGTRMGSLTATHPKPLLEVAGRPVLDYLLDQILELSGLGTVHVVSNRRYLTAFRDWAEGWRRRIPTLALEVHDDGSQSSEDRLGAIGDLRFVLERDPCPGGALVAAGDNIFRFSLVPLWSAFLGDGHSRLLALHEPELAKLQRTGVLELGDGGRVLRLHEKPLEPPSSWACPSLYGLSGQALREVAPYLSAGGSSDEIGRYVGHLVNLQPVFAVESRGERLHVGSPESLRAADHLLRRETAERRGLVEK